MGVRRRVEKLIARPAYFKKKREPPERNIKISPTFWNDPHFCCRRHSVSKGKT